jgi:hypothetical protein
VEQVRAGTSFPFCHPDFRFVILSEAKDLAGSNR